MPAHNHFDVVVLGGQLAGTLAAALLAKRHRRVAVIDTGETHGCYRVGGVRYPFAPELIPNLDGAAMRIVHDELGVSPDLRITFRPLELLYQSIDQNHRMDVHTAHDAFADEVGREYPEARAAAAGFHSRLLELGGRCETALREVGALPPAGFWARRRAAKLVGALPVRDGLLDGLPADHPVRATLLAPSGFFGQLVPSGDGGVHLVHLLAGYFRGAWTAPNRATGLRGFFAQVGERLGVEAVPGRLTRIEVKSGRIVALHVAGRQDLITADAVLAAPVATDLAALVSDPKVAARLRQSAPAPARWLYTVSLLVNREVLPAGMCDTAVLLSPPGLGAPVLLAVYPCAREADATPVPDRAVLTASTQVDALPPDATALREQLVAATETVVPFLHEHLHAVVTAADAGFDPWRVQPAYATTRTGLHALLGQPLRTPLKNLIPCGHEVVPALGIEGAYLCALGVARTIEERHPRQK